MSSIKDNIIDSVTAFVNRKVYVSRRDVKEILGRITYTTVIAGLFFFLGAGIYLHDRAESADIISYEMDIKLIDLDLKRDNSWRLYYDDKVKEGYVLTPADHAHLERINERLERNYTRIKILNENLGKLK